MPPDLAARAERIARTWLYEDPGGLRLAERSTEAVGMLFDAENLGDADVVHAAVWATAAVRAVVWSDFEGSGYSVEDVRCDLGHQVARIVSWCVQEEWQSEAEHLNELVGYGPVQAKVVMLARSMAVVVSGPGPRVTERQATRVMKLAMSIPALVPKVVAEGWPVAIGEA